MSVSEQVGTEASFDGALFLSELREALSDPETNTPLSGNVKAVHRPYLDVYSTEAGIKAKEHIEAAYADTDPAYSPIFDRLREDYEDSFVLSARGLGVATLRLADRTDESFATAMEEPENRSVVLNELGRDMRRTALYLCGKDLSTLSKTDFITSFLLYHAPAELKALQVDPQYAELGSHWIKRAVTGYVKDPAGFLDKVIDTTDRLLQNPKYAPLGASHIKKAVVTHSNNPEAWLDRIVSETQRLLAIPGYAELGATHITSIVAAHRDAEKHVKIAASKARELMAKPQYALLGKGTINVAIISYPTNPEGYLEAATQKMAELRNNPAYRHLAASVLKEAVRRSVQAPEKHLTPEALELRNARVR